MQITQTSLPGVLMLNPQYFEDERGFFSEVYSAKTLENLGIKDVFVQDSEALSIKTGTLRGLHFQNNPKPITKIFKVIDGEVKAVVVDLMKSSPTYKKWETFILNDKNHNQLYIPKGFALGYLTLQPNTKTSYKFDNFFDIDLDRAIRFDDEEIGIDWELDKYNIPNPVLSKKDLSAPLLKNSDVNF